jgi:hypothetical protein
MELNAAGRSRNHTISQPPGGHLHYNFTQPNAVSAQLKSRRRGSRSQSSGVGTCPGRKEFEGAGKRNKDMFLRIMIIDTGERRRRRCRLANGREVPVQSTEKGKAGFANLSEELSFRRYYMLKSCQCLPEIKYIHRTQKNRKLEDHLHT